VADVRISNRDLGRWPTLAIMVVVGATMGEALRTTTWKMADPAAPVPTTYAIGDGFLTTYVLPFELASIVLLAALIGAVVLSRKELKDERA
jgi:NADH-quinone oxidoreductase subunit J